MGAPLVSLAAFIPLVATVIAFADPVDDAPAAKPDAAPAVTTVEFDDEETEPPELVTSRKDTEFDSLLPERFHPDPAAPDPPATPRRRGGCSGCATGGDPWGWAAVALAGILLAGLRRLRVRSSRRR